MRIGVGLPSVIPGAAAELMLDWARQADAGPFSTVATHDRIAYDTFEAMTVLAAAAAVTTRVRLATLVLIAPLRSLALLAKQSATLDALSGGRLTLGVGVGPRRDDYEAGEARFGSRGRRLDEQLRSIRDWWEEHRVGPTAAGDSGPELLVGGAGDQALARVARYADGFVHAGGPPRAFAGAADRAWAAWSDTGRPGRPRLVGTGYFALGPEAAEEGAGGLRRYYSFVGGFVERIAAGLLTSEEGIRDYVRGYQEAGCDELILFPTVARIEQLDRLAQAVD
jgi:alkanesulfonate monooxygenase SsuD/methylene tetrahydromethanopterin reductase-like flavin-dependent oxidoreductase (luciferase family)